MDGTDLDILARNLQNFLTTMNDRVLQNNNETQQYSLSNQNVDDNIPSIHKALRKYMEFYDK